MPSLDGEGGGGTDGAPGRARMPGRAAPDAGPVPRTGPDPSGRGQHRPQPRSRNNVCAGTILCVKRLFERAGVSGPRVGRIYVFSCDCAFECSAATARPLGRAAASIRELSRNLLSFEIVLGRIVLYQEGVSGRFPVLLLFDSLFLYVDFALYFIGFLHCFFPRLRENGPGTSSSE